MATNTPKVGETKEVRVTMYWTGEKWLTLEQLALHVKMLMESMPAEARSGIMDNWCRGCGGPPTCKCWNDE